MKRIAATVLCLAMIAGCSPAPGTDEPSSAAGGKANAAEKTGGAAEPPPEQDALPAPPAKVVVSSPTNFTNDFTGPALAFMRQSAIQPPPELLSEVTEHVRNAKGLVDACRPSPGNNQAYLADVDGDGTWEGIALYTLDNCGAPDNVVRTLMVLRQQKDTSWKSVLEVATSVKLGAQRPIIAIGDGKITLAPEPDGMGGVGEAEVLVVPKSVESE